MKQKTKYKKDIVDAPLGDSWVFTALERNSKLVLAGPIGHRTEYDTIQFTEKLAYATEGNFQVTTDGFKPYQHAIVLSLGAHRVDFAQLVKLYAADPENERRYSPALCTGCKKSKSTAIPIWTVFQPLTLNAITFQRETQSRRYTRLTNAFSKKWTKHQAALALWYAYFNFCRVHRSLKVTRKRELPTTSGQFGNCSRPEAAQ